MSHLSYKPSPQRCLQKISNCSIPYNIKTFLSSSPTKLERDYCPFRKEAWWCPHSRVCKDRAWPGILWGLKIILDITYLLLDKYHSSCKKKKKPTDISLLWHPIPYPSTGSSRSTWTKLFLFKSWFCHCVWSWTSHLNFLCLSLIISKTEIGLLGTWDEFMNTKH